MLNDNPLRGLVRRWGAQKKAQFKESDNGDNGGKDRMNRIFWLFLKATIKGD